MVNASKILTVSYGTFSCTLEGFDDPFSTMRSIAEYFRDLAADDRYFGAEPPTPDAEMLHRIAERENRRKVEAQVGDNGVVLRQVADQSDREQTKPAVAAEMPAHAEPTPDIEDEASEFDVSDNSVAAKLARIRAAVARSRVESEPLLNAVFAEDEHAELSSAVAAKAEPELIDEPIDELIVEGNDEDLSDLMDAIASDDTIDGQSASDAADEDDLTAMLDQAVEENATLDEEDEANIALDDAPLDLDALPNVEPTSDAVEELGEDDASVSDTVGDAVNDAVNDSAIYDEYSAEDEAFAKASIPEDLQEKAPTIVLSKPEPEETLTDDLDLSALMSDEDVAPISAELETAETEPTEFEDEFAVELSKALADPVEDVSDILTTSEADSDESFDATLDDDAKPRVRVMKMRRDEFEAFINDSDVETIDAEDIVEDGPEFDEPQGADTIAADGIRETLGDTGLSDEEEEELIKELVAVELDLEDEDVLDPVDDLAHDETYAAAETPAPSARPVAPEHETKADDASVDRLMTRADTALEEDEGTRRRSAIAHLKAAVAAVRADGDKVKETAEAENARTMDKFRDDLARAVRPTKPEIDAETATDLELEDTDASAEKPVVAPAKVQRSGTSTPRPGRPIAPLMLVSEQRVDAPDEMPEAPAAQPVRPRRVQATDIDNDLFTDDGATGEDQAAGNLFSEGSDFQGYVAESGAEGIQELLEASLAYGTLVEGADNNSRPHIMRRMLSLFPDGSVTREDGLRAFGVLLREGRIQRVQRGQFVLPASSRFHAEPVPKANSA